MTSADCLLAVRTDDLSIAVRAFVPLLKAEQPRRPRQLPEPSEWVLVFDTETTTDPSQRLRLGSFQLRYAGKLVKHGLFYDPATLTKKDQRVLARYARAKSLELLSAADFVEHVFFRFGYGLRSTIVGFNLPFDISRLAIRWGSARRRPMRGGFSFQLSPNPYRPRVQVKHLSRRADMTRFTAPARQRTPRGMRKHSRVPVRRGFFVDVKTIGGALTSRPNDTLASLAAFLDVPSRKLATEEHGGPLTPAYLDYALQDVQVTWECYAELSRRYAAHGLMRTPIHRIKSEAGIGKAYLKEMGIAPWRLMQPDFPPEIINIIMQTYYGGRAEVHLRRTAVQVLYCDFLSMYPTVCTLMGLWRWVIAKGVGCHDATDEARALLASIVLRDLCSGKQWPDLAMLVQILPNNDVLPLRAQYSGDAQYTIGLNHVSSDMPLWYTLADCIASKVITGKAPTIIRALRFGPKGMQAGLRPVNVAGNTECQVDPRKHDFYRRVIELRSSIKAQLRICPTDQREILHSQQQTLKILANATSYGIFMEMNVEELAKTASALRYTENGDAMPISIGKAEVPGSYFHPLLASLITSAARLLLAIAERMATDAGIDWAFCDTDSMAFAKPPTMGNTEFHAKVDAIRNWSDCINPYDGAGELFKVEDVNFELLDGRIGRNHAPLFAYATSAKRHTLFNIDSAGQLVIRKASAHGLGHLMAPYTDAGAPLSIPAPAVPLKEIGVDRWQYDVWYRILDGALNGNPDQPRFSDLPGFDKPAVSRYAATTPALLRWFDRYNAGRTEADRVRPFNFLTVLTARQTPSPDWEIVGGSDRAKRRKRRQTDSPRPVAPYTRDPARAAASCFDRVTGAAVAPDRLKTYAEALSNYHLHPEAKFLNGDYLDRGATARRHVQVAGIRYIGKEANRWEEQFHLGHNPEAQIEYDSGPEATVLTRDRICKATAAVGQRVMAKASGVSREALRAIISGKAAPRAKTVARLLAAISTHTGRILTSTPGQ